MRWRRSRRVASEIVLNSCSVAECMRIPRPNASTLRQPGQGTKDPSLGGVRPQILTSRNSRPQCGQASGGENKKREGFFFISCSRTLPSKDSTGRASKRERPAIRETAGGPSKTRRAERPMRFESMLFRPGGRVDPKIGGPGSIARAPLRACKFFSCVQRGWAAFAAGLLLCSAQ